MFVSQSSYEGFYLNAAFTGPKYFRKLGYLKSFAKVTQVQGYVLEPCIAVASLMQKAIALL